jgi:uncharacterized protein (TIGR02680 family)
MTVTELAAHRTAEPISTPAEESAGIDRWRPIRAGIINVWRYYDETFRFHHGRLLLRGPNGTGKSKALELLLPYLMDANLRPHRLSTFGSGDRTMHWNLMGQGNQGSTRVGYVWLEFGRGDGARPEWFCCGARLQATTNTTNVQPTYFTTTQRIGLPGGLPLVNDAGRPLTRADLASAIGDAGVVHPSPTEYRRAVRRTLFPGITEQRYDALITALLQLRTPKLSERLDPAVLSTLLSRALPPLDQNDLTEIAEGFERLDRQREELKQLDAEVAAADTLATRQRTYAQRVLRAGAAGLISTTSTMNETTRTARESRQRLERTEQTLAGVADRDDILRRRTGELDARIQGIVDLPAYRQGSELDRLRGAVAAAHDRAAEAARHAATLRRQADRKAGEAARDARAAEEARRAVSRVAAEARQAADRAGMPAVHAEMESVSDLKTGRGLLRAAVDSRQAQVATVRDALAAHHRAVELRSGTERRLADAQDDLAAWRARAEAATVEYQRSLAVLADELVAWARGAAGLALPDPDRLAELVADSHAVLAVVNDAAGVARERLTREESALRHEHDAVSAELNPYQAELARLDARVDPEPPPPYTRRARREPGNGAPLWRLLDFRPGVPDAARARVEAALEAAGLLDAWVLPSGTLTAAAEDRFAEAELADPAPGRSLTDLLTVVPDAPVPTERLNRLLAGIAVGDTAPPHPAAIGTDGTWRLAATHGRWTKPEAEYLGATARERARQRRIAELTVLIDSLHGRLGELDDALAGVARRRESLAAELSRRPGYGAVDAAARRLTSAEAECGTRADAVAGWERELGERDREVAAALRELTSAGAEHGLPTSDDGLTRVSNAVAALRAAGDAWLDDRQRADTAATLARGKAEDATEAGAVAGEAERTAASRAEEAEATAVTLRTIESSIGVEYRELVEELTGLRAESRQVRQDREGLRAEENTLRARIGELGERYQEAERAMGTATSTRDAAEERFRQLALGTLPADARVDIDPARLEAKRSTLDTARWLAETWSGVPYEPRNVRDAEARLADAVHDSQPTLQHRADLSLDPDDDIRVLTASVDGARLGAAGLLDLLRAERTQMAEHITADERKLFDQTLTGDTRRHLAERIRGANELVDAMNERLERVRTASNVRVRLVWQVDPQLPAGTREARDLLLRNPVTLTDAERDALHRFFRERVDEARSTETATSWEQQLMRVLDYTAWHQFVVKIDRGSGDGWQPMTKRLHGALSGGEKAIVLHLPLFAAAAAHYRSTPAAPRLILLDEVFVGVDTTNRGQLLELLAAFDLDMVLTSDHEWCDYRELSGIAIHQLVTGDDGDDAVTTVRFTWDGRHVLPDDDD